MNSMNRGGAENAIMNYYRYMDRSKVQFDFLLTDGGSSLFEPEIVALGGRIYRLPSLTARNPFPYIKSVNSFFKEHPEYKIVHSHTSSKSSIPLAIAKLRKIPVRICHSHNTQSESGLKGMVRDFLKIPLKTVATDFCACGENAAVWLYGRKSFDSGKVFIVENVIECSRFGYDPTVRQEILKSLGINGDTAVLGCSARFSPQKNIGFALDVFREFHTLTPNSVLLLLGDGDLREQIDLKIKEYGLSDSAISLGVVSNPNDYYQAMDIFLMPSLHEGLPLSLIEAQISGLKCFASTGVPREADKTGLVTFLPLSEGPEYWAHQIQEALPYHRESQIEVLKEAGYDAATSAVRLQTFYQEAFERGENL